MYRPRISLTSLMIPLVIILLLFSSHSVSCKPGKKILVVFSGVDYISLKDGNLHKTGYFLSELATPLKGLISAGYEIEFANPTGKEPVMDISSDNPQFFKTREDYLDAKKLIRMEGMKNPKKLSSCNEVELDEFFGIFLPGGHAPMEDLYKDRNLGRILIHFHNNHKPTALICHAPVALLSAVKGDKWIYNGYKLTAFSNEEEIQTEKSGALGGKVNFYISDALAKAGALVSHAQKPWQSHVVRDRELITAQNPMSDVKFTEVFLKALSELK